MKKLIFLIITFLNLNIATAQQFTINDITYSNIINTNTVEVIDKLNCYSGSVTLPETVTYDAVDYNVVSIGESAFAFCSNLTEVNLPNSINFIGEFAFYGTGIRTIRIPNSVTTIQSSTFGRCESLETVTLPRSLTSIGTSAFSFCNKLERIDLPNSLTSIEEGGFGFCSGLKTVNFGNSLTTIEEAAFTGCTSLSSIDLPNSLITIGRRAFSTCNQLSTVHIKDKVTSIGNEAFMNCELRSLTIDVINPIVIISNVFRWVSLNMAALQVPDESLEAYKGANVWKEFGSINGTLGIDDIETLKDAISVYPAPAQNTLNIGLKASIGLQNASLLNLQGKVVKTTMGSTINISDLKSGMYILKLSTSQGVITKKVIKS